MEKEPKKPLEMPQKPGIVEPIIAAGEMKQPPSGPMSSTDPQGSYTGTPADDDEPVQDADDL